MKDKKNFFEKGYATTVLMIFIICMFVIGIIISTKIAGKYILRVKAQTWTDAMTDAASAYSSSRNGFDTNKAYEAFNMVRSYADKEFKYGITFNMWMNSDQIGIDTYYEYPWMAAGSANSIFNFYSTYPVAHVNAESHFLYNGNENIIDYAIAVPTDKTKTLNITDSSDPNGTKGISVGGIVRKNTLKNLADQLQSQDIGRYNYSGRTKSWCGDVSAQTLYTQDIISLLGSPNRTAYPISDIYNLNTAISVDYTYDYFGYAASSNSDHLSTIADKQICSIEVDGDEYIIYKLSSSATALAMVLTPDGLKTMRLSSSGNPIIYVYDINTSFY